VYGGPSLSISPIKKGRKYQAIIIFLSSEMKGKWHLSASSRVTRIYDATKRKPTPPHTSLGYNPIRKNFLL